MPTEASAFPGTSPITAIVYSCDEADLLPSCLSRLAGFAEVIVCDMGSQDDTVAVATAHGARVVTVPRVPVVEEVRQLGLDASRTDWVFFVDADEHIEPEMRERLEEFVAARPELAAVRLRYDNVAFGTVLRHSLVGSAKYALMHTARTHYPPMTHAHVPPQFDAPVADAPPQVPAVLHHNFRSIAQSTEKTLRYATNNPGGDEILADPLRIVRLVMREVVVSGAWRDGRTGVSLAIITTFGRLYAAMAAWEAAGYPEPGWAPRTASRLDALSATQRAIVRTREFGAGVRQRTSRRPSQNPE